MYKKTTAFGLVGLAAGFSMLPSNVAAYEQGEVILRGGIVLMEPREDSDPLFLSANVTGFGSIAGPMDGTSIGVDNEFTLAGTLAYMLNDNWGLELVIGVPAEFNIPSKGLEDLGVTKVGTTDVVPIIVSLQHYFNVNHERLQPYVGLGVNYTVLRGEKVSDELEVALAAQDQDLEFDNSFSYTLNAGLDFQLDDRWLLNASVYYVDLETDAELSFTNSQGISDMFGFPLPATGTIETTVDVPTWAYFLTAGYRF